jgi:hypothetical protein
MTPTPRRSIRTLIERSSLGTPTARRARSTVPLETGRHLAARAVTRAAKRSSPKREG